MTTIGGPGSSAKITDSVLARTIDKLAKRLSDIAESMRVRKTTYECSGNQFLSHFTGMQTLPWILNDAKTGGGSLSLRLTDVRYLNDPMEGSALDDSMGDNNEKLASLTDDQIDPRVPNKFRKEEIEAIRWLSSWIRTGNMNTVELLPRPYPFEKRSKGVYLASFTARKDELDLWRAYGKDGTGVCLSMPMSIALKRLDELSKQVRLYAVRYSNEEKWLAWEHVAELAFELRVLISPSCLTGDMEIAREQIGSHLNLLQHLFKHEQYRSEEELRLLYVGSPATADADIHANRLFLKSPQFFLGGGGSEIILGPCLPNKEKWKETLSIETRSIWGDQAPEVLISQVPYIG